MSWHRFIIAFIVLVAGHLSLSTQSASAAPHMESRPICDGNFVTRLDIGERAEVKMDPPLANRVRSQPALTATIVGRIQPGEGMVLLDGPTCAGGWIWWYVRSDEGVTGWTVEGNATEYSLVPVASRANTPSISNIYSCIGPCAADGSNTRQTFAEGTSRIHLRWEYENIPVGARYTRSWSMNGYEWVRYECAWPGPETGIHEISLLESSGLYSGVWKMRIEVEGVPIAEKQVTVTGDHRVWEPVGVLTDCAYGVSPLDAETPTDKPSSRVTVIPMSRDGLVNANANLRTGPSTAYPHTGRVAEGAIVAITGRNTTSTWYRLDSGQWIASSLVDLCELAYPTLCFPEGLPDLDCSDLTNRNFRVLPPDPHGFDGDGDGIGCEVTAAPEPEPQPVCDPNYTGACIPLVSYDLDCDDIPDRRFRSVGSDPHNFDGDGDGIACER